MIEARRVWTWSGYRTATRALEVDDDGRVTQHFPDDEDRESKRLGSIECLDASDVPAELAEELEALRAEWDELVKEPSLADLHREWDEDYRANCI